MAAETRAEWWLLAVAVVVVAVLLAVIALGTTGAPARVARKTFRGDPSAVVASAVGAPTPHPVDGCLSVVDPAPPAGPC
jgi:hypothetical protein